MTARVVSQEGTLIGKIISKENLVGVMTTSIILLGSIETAINLVGSLSMPDGYEEYLGNYTITPSVSEQTISTEDKHLTGDITIEPIPYYEVSNEQSGQTAIIGG